MEEIKIADLILKGWKEPARIVRKCTPTSGAIYLHKRYIGKTYDLYLIPVEEEPQVAAEVKKAEEKFKELKELKKEIQ